jgi:hypothetical protein
VPALELLNARAGDFDASQVLKMLPPNWSVSVVETFLRGALRASLHKVGTINDLPNRDIYKGQSINNGNIHITSDGGCFGQCGW